eukprot:g16698.t1
MVGSVDRPPSALEQPPGIYTLAPEYEPAPNPAPTAIANAPDGAPTGNCERHLLTGCYELLHFGHLNALRQHVHVVAGVHPNDEILRVKGGVCILDEAEKERLLLGCKFVDEVAHGVPYDTVRPENYDCAYCWHGDDEVVVGGNDIFAHAKQSHRFKTLRRTEGISTTLMIARFFQQEEASSQAMKKSPLPPGGSPSTEEENAEENLGEAILSMQDKSGIQYINATASRISRFFLPNRPRSTCKAVVYLQGCFDLFHVGYLDLLGLVLEAERNRLRLESVREVFLIIGVLHSEELESRRSAGGKLSAKSKSRGRSADGGSLSPSSLDEGHGTTGRKRKKSNKRRTHFRRCLQSLHERAISILSLRCVDDVVLDVQNSVDETFRRSLGITAVYGVRNHCDFASPAEPTAEAGADMTLSSSTCSKSSSSTAEVGADGDQEIKARTSDVESPRFAYVDHWIDGAGVFSSKTIQTRVLQSRVHQAKPAQVEQ